MVGNLSRNKFLVPLTKNETAFAEALQDALIKAFDHGEKKITSIWAYLEPPTRNRLARDFVAGVSTYADNHFKTADKPAFPAPLTPHAITIDTVAITTPCPPVGVLDIIDQNRLLSRQQLDISPLVPNSFLDEGGIVIPAPCDNHSQAQEHDIALPRAAAYRWPHQQDTPETENADTISTAQAQTAAVARRGVNHQSPMAPNFWPLWIDQQDGLLRQCLKLMSGNMDDAQDALSEAMVKASVKFEDSMDQIRNPRAWLSRIVHNACIDLHRQNKRKAEYNEDAHSTADEAMPEITRRDSTTPEQNALTGEMFANLDKALADLPEKLRRPLLMRCVQDQSYDEIAENLGLSNCAVRKRVQLARDQLRGCEIR